MFTRVRAMVIGAIAFAAAAAWAAPITGLQPLSGEWWVAGASINDPPADEPQNTHFKMHLTGPAARALYDAMQVTAERDVCLDDGTLSKVVGQMQCWHAPAGDSDSCSFAIDVAKQQIVAATDC